MINSDVYTLDPESLRYKSQSELCDVIEQLITIVRDQDHTIQIQASVIDSLEDDKK